MYLGEFMGKIKKRIIIFNMILIIILICFITFNHINIIFSKSYNEMEYVEVNNNDIDNMFSIDVDLDILRNDYNNDDIVGRLEIPGLFNLIITQGEDNEYYLNHNLLNKKDIKGNEYLDYRNNINDKNINIYGHNSSIYNVPFKKLESFIDKDNFNESKYILFQHDQGRRVYEIVSFKMIDKDYEHMNIDSVSQKEHIDILLKDSMHLKDIDYSDDTNVIVLQTCSMDDSDSFYILVGFEVI